MKLNKPLGFNLAAPFFIDIYIKEMLKTLEYCDYVFCNDDEAAVMAKHLGLDGKDVKGVAKRIATMPKANKKRPERVVLITCGKEPTVLARSNGKGGASVKGIPVPRLDQSKVIDTNGAGDSFVGAFYATLVGGGSLEMAVKAG